MLRPSHLLILNVTIKAKAEFYFTERIQSHKPEHNFQQASISLI